MLSFLLSHCLHLLVLNCGFQFISMKHLQLSRELPFHRFLLFLLSTGEPQCPLLVLQVLSGVTGCAWVLPVQWHSPCLSVSLSWTSRLLAVLSVSASILLFPWAFLQTIVYRLLFASDFVSTEASSVSPSTVSEG